MKMKKTKLMTAGLVLAISAFALVGCGSDQSGEATGAPANEMVQTMITDVELGMMMELDAEQIEEMFGLTAEDYVSANIQVNGMNMQSTEFGIFQVTGATTVVEAGIVNRMETAMANWMPGYMPEEYFKMENYTIAKVGEYVIYVVADTATKNALLGNIYADLGEEFTPFEEEVWAGDDMTDQLGDAVAPLPEEGEIPVAPLPEDDLDGDKTQAPVIPVQPPVIPEPTPVVPDTTVEVQPEENGETSTSQTAQTIFDSVVAGVELGMLMQMDEYIISDFHGLATTDYKTAAVFASGMNIKSTEIGVFEAKDAAGVDTIKAGIKTRMETAIANWMPGYMPEEIANMENYSVFVNGNFVMYVVADDTTKATLEANFNAQF